jgi:hypothetical protein
MRSGRREAPPTAVAVGGASAVGFGGPDRPANRTKAESTVKHVSGKVFAGKRQIGAVIQTSAGFVAWWKGGRAGVFDTYGLAVNAVHAAVRTDAMALRRRQREAAQP